MNLELLGALNELEKERGISREVLIRAIEDAIQSALRRSAQPSQNLRVDFDERSGRVRVFARKAVVRHVVDPANEISLEEAQRLNPRFEVDDVVEVELTLPDLGRIAAQTAKQVVVQRIREAERNRIYDEFHSREGDILTGVIRRIEHRNVYVDLGRAEGVVPPSEQVATERYAPGVRMKFYLAEVRKTTKGPQIILSRSHPGLLKRLFELEVPEIHDGVVEIKAWAREPGHRSKIAVWSTDRNVDPVGACVGPRGARVQQVVKELRQEKVDVIAWDPDVEVFIANALQPARVLKVYLDPDERTARVIVPEMQLSLHIGKEGQNARLAAKLTGWRIDIKSEAQWDEVEREFQEKRQKRPPVEGQPPAARPEAEPAFSPAAAVAVPSAADQVEPVEAEAVPAEALPAAQEDLLAGADEVPPQVSSVDEEEDEEQRLRVKGGGKVRRLKGFRRLERRHLEEELEDAEALPTLFGQEDEAEAEQAPEPPAQQGPATAERAVPPAGGGGLSVRLLDLLKAQEVVGKAQGLEAPSAARQDPRGPDRQARPEATAAQDAQGSRAAQAVAGGRGSAGGRGAAAEVAEPAGAAAPAPARTQAGQPPALSGANLPAGSGRAADAQTDGSAEKPGERPAAQSPGPRGAEGARGQETSAAPAASGSQAASGGPAAGADRQQQAGSRQAPQQPAKPEKKGKVLKSLAELRLEDFGFTAPASGEKGKARGR